MIDNAQAKEIIKYLGYKNTGADNKTLLKISELREKLIAGISHRYTYKKFSVNKTRAGIEIAGTNIILEGKCIGKFLKDSDEIFLMAATLGLESERFILRIQKVSLSDGVLADAVASAYIEEVCNEIQSEISQQYNINGRFSCGYCDLPINIQPEILKALNAQKLIGLYCNENYIMLPRKSVTAIMGIKP